MSAIPKKKKNLCFQSILGEGPGFSVDLLICIVLRLDFFLLNKFDSTFTTCQKPSVADWPRSSTPSDLLGGGNRLKQRFRL